VLTLMDVADLHITYLKKWNGLALF